MATVEQITTALEQYVERFNAGDATAWSELFAENAEQEDPVGAPVNVGRPAIRAFYENVRQLGPARITVEREPIVVGDEAILCFSVTTDVGDQRIKVPFIVDHFVFDEAGLIASLRAFYDPASILVEAP